MAIKVGASSPVKSTASDAWDFIKGEAASAASSILTEAASDLKSYAEKKVTTGAEGVKTAVSGSSTASALARDLGLGGVPIGTIAVAVLGLAVLFTVFRR